MRESITQHLSLTQAVRLVKGYQSTSKDSSHDRIPPSLKQQLFQHFYQHCSIATMSALLHSTSLFKISYFSPIIVSRLRSYPSASPYRTSSYLLLYSFAILHLQCSYLLQHPSISTLLSSTSPVCGNTPSHLQVAAELSRCAAVQLDDLLHLAVIGNLAVHGYASLEVPAGEAWGVEWREVRIELSLRDV